MGAAVEGIGGGVEPHFVRRHRRLTAWKNFAQTIATFFCEISTLGTKSKDCRLKFKVGQLCVCTLTVTLLQIEFQE